MKKVGFAVLVILFVWGSVASADPTFTLSWQVNSLSDDSGAPVTGLLLDVEFGNQFYQMSGVAFVGQTGAVAFGSGFDDPVGAVMYLNVGQHLLTIFMDDNLNGDISIYGPDNKLIDTGTVTFLGIE